MNKAKKAAELQKLRFEFENAKQLTRVLQYVHDLVVSDVASGVCVQTCKVCKASKSFSENTTITPLVHESDCVLQKNDVLLLLNEAKANEFKLAFASG